MNTSRLAYPRILLLGAILVVLLVLLISFGGLKNPGTAVGRSPNSPAAISPAQQAAINGAAQLLLLQPQATEMLYLPLIRH